MRTTAVVLEKPKSIGLEALALNAPSSGDVVVDVRFSGISTGTERLLWDGRMPAFPGMGYPLVPGYEAVGEVVDMVGTGGELQIGDTVFVPGAHCFADARALFGASSKRLVTAHARAVRIDAGLAEAGVALALAATAHHAIVNGGMPGLVVGHGVFGRLIARLVIALGGEPPVVWERDVARRSGAAGYGVIAPEDDERRDYAAIYDASGDAGLVNQLVGRLALGGEIVLAGFYPGDVSFAFAPAFMREARFRISSEWKDGDLQAVVRLIDDGRLSLAELVSHVEPANAAVHAYEVAFGDARCIKMALDWKAIS